MNLFDMKPVLSVLAAMPLLFIQMDQAIASHAATIVAVKEVKICLFNKATEEKIGKCILRREIKQFNMKGTSQELPQEI